jgi:hypothetical protein
MAAVIAALRNNRVRVPLSVPDEGDPDEEAVLKLTSSIPHVKDIESDLLLGMLMIDG